MRDVSFGMQYVYDIDKSWSFTFASDISNQALQSTPANLQWNLMNVKNNRVLQDWSVTNKSDLVAGTVS